MRLSIVCAAGFFVAVLMAQAALAGVPEPEGLWTGAMQSETPSTLAGARIVDAEQAKDLAAAGALLLDVSAETPPPPSPPKLWSPIHRSIPGAHWWPGAGRGDADAAFAAKFSARLAALSGGDQARPLVFFCHPRCWGSWNAAKRALGLGYREVHWYPGGIEGWEEKYPAAALTPDPDWTTPSR